jgi:hypothetical protein
MVQRVAIVAACFALAGCCELPFRASEVPVDAPAQGGIWARQVEFQVFGPDEPADGVPLFVFWPDSTNVARIYLMGLRSEAGLVTARVPADVPVHVVAGGSPDWTEEWLPDVLAPGGDAASVTVRVYPRFVQGTANATWSPAAASLWRETGNGPVAWELHDVTPGASNETRVGFAERLAAVRGTVAWENTLTAHADLGFAAWHSNSQGLRCTVHDAEDQLGRLGPLNESYDSALDGYDAGAPCGVGTPFGDVAAEDAPAGVYMGAATGRPAAMPLGLPYSVDYTLEFGYPVGIEELCDRMAGPYDLYYVDPATGNVTRIEKVPGAYTSPTPIVPLFAVALLAVAAVARSRRRAQP